MMRNTVLRVAIFGLWGVFSLLVSIYLTFPTDTLGAVIKAQGEAFLNFEYRIALQDVSLAGLTGVSVEGLGIHPFRGGEEDGEGEESDEAGGLPRMALSTQIEEATVLINPLSVASGDPNVSFEVEIGGGVLEGTWERDSEVEGGHVLTVDIRGIPVSSLGLLLNLIQMPLSGAVHGSAQLHLDAQSLITDGTIDVEIGDTVRAPGFMPIGQAGVTFVTPVRLGSVLLSAIVEDSIASFDLTNSPAPDQPAPDITVDVVQGRITLGIPYAHSSTRMPLQLRFDEQWVSDNDFDGILGMPEFQRYCGGSQCGMLLTGSLGRLTVRPLAGGGGRL